MALPVKTRFAPSPTGFLHVGGVRTALFAWLVAEQAKGQFVIRIEDTDRQRHVKGAEQHIFDSLKWLGIESAEEPLRQSERLKVYHAWAEKMIAAGRAYADPTTNEELEAMRLKAKAAKQPFMFRDFRPAKTPAWDGKMPLRFLSDPKAYKWNDLVMGDLQSGPEAIDDFILIKSDGYPTYNFAHIVDDFEMKITHVIRSQEFLPSVPRFLNLYEALEVPRPHLATLPYVLAPEGNKKLSKRDGAKDILDYRREGYMPEALVNFLATLGWNDGSEQEIYSITELIEKFDLGRVQRSGARFDEQRLLWMNGHYIRELPLDDLMARAETFWPKEAADADADYKHAILALVQERLKYLAELPKLSDFFFSEPSEGQVLKLYREPVDKQLQKQPPDYREFLDAVRRALMDSDFSRDDISERLNKLLDQLQTKPAVLFPVIRIALSGSNVSPEIFGTLEVLGKVKSLERIHRAYEAL